MYTCHQRSSVTIEHGYVLRARVTMQMGHELPNMVGVDTKKLDRRMSRVLPQYMSMGATGMGAMGEMEMPIPPNSLPMRGGKGPFSYIDMGGMFTILKVREGGAASDFDGWYKYPKGSVAGSADPTRMKQDGIDPSRGRKKGN